MCATSHLRRRCRPGSGGDLMPSSAGALGTVHRAAWRLVAVAGVLGLSGLRRPPRRTPRRSRSSPDPDRRRECPPDAAARNPGTRRRVALRRGRASGARVRRRAHASGRCPDSAAAQRSPRGSAGATHVGDRRRGGFSTASGRRWPSSMICMPPPLDLLPTLASLAAARTVVCARSPRTAPPPVRHPAWHQSPTDPARLSALRRRVPEPRPRISARGRRARRHHPNRPRRTPALASPAAALPYLAASRAAVYGLEVVAARTHKDLRTARRPRWNPSADSPWPRRARPGRTRRAIPTAYRLPLNADDEESGRRLAEYPAGCLVDAYAAALTTTTDAGTHASTSR